MVQMLRSSKRAHPRNVCDSTRAAQVGLGAALHSWPPHTNGLDVCTAQYVHVQKLSLPALILSAIQSQPCPALPPRRNVLSSLQLPAAAGAVSWGMVVATVPVMMSSMAADAGSAAGAVVAPNPAAVAEIAVVMGVGAAVGMVVGEGVGLGVSCGLAALSVFFAAGTTLRVARKHLLRLLQPFTPCTGTSTVVQRAPLKCTPWHFGLAAQTSMHICSVVAAATISESIL